MLDEKREAQVSQYNRWLDLESKISFYDSTLRDGEQMPGISFSQRQKLAIARVLDDMRVPQIEAGFPACSEGERNAIKAIVAERFDARILGLARLVKGDLDHAIECGIDTALLFVPCSEVQITHSSIKKEEIPRKIEFAVDYLKKHGVRPSFSTMDSTRGDVAFQLHLFETALRAGARRIGVTDTIGCIAPDAFERFVLQIKNKINALGLGKIGDEIELSVHCHNDFGLALANGLAGVRAGATAVATTTTGIGERAGNVPTEQFVMAMKHLYNVDLGIKTECFGKLSRMIARYAKLRLPKNAPFIGDNAFSHESGVHVQAVLVEPFAYEPVSPESVGNRRRIMLGKHSGLAGLKDALGKMEVRLSEEEITGLLEEVKRLGERKGTVTNADLRRLIGKRKAIMAANQVDKLAI